MAENRAAGQLGIAGRWVAVLVSGVAGRVAVVPEAGVIASGRRAGADGGVGLGWRQAAARLAWWELDASKWLLWPVMLLMVLYQVSHQQILAAGWANLAGYRAACRPDAAAARRR